MSLVYKHYERIYSTFVQSNDKITVPNLHYHNVYEIYYLVKGSRTYVIDGRLYKIAKGEVVLVPPSVLHQTAGKQYTRYALYFSKEFLLRFFTKDYLDSLLEIFKLKHLHPTSEDSALLLELFTSIHKYDQESKINEVVALLPSLFTILRRAVSKEDAVNRFQNKQIATILDYVEKNFLTVDSLETLANALYINKYHLSHLFKEAVNIPLMTYVYNLKLSYSCHLLITTKKSVGAIAMECGFTSQITYCNRFKAKFDCSPLSYRKQMSPAQKKYPPPVSVKPV